MLLSKMYFLAEGSFENLAHFRPFIQMNLPFIQMNVPFIQMNVPFIQVNVPFIQMNLPFMLDFVVAREACELRGITEMQRD